MRGETEQNSNFEAGAQRIVERFSFWKRERPHGVEPKGARVDKLWKLFLLGLVIVNAVGIGLHAWLFFGIRSDEFFAAEAGETEATEIVSREELRNLIEGFEKEAARHAELIGGTPMATPPAATSTDDGG